MQEEVNSKVMEEDYKKGEKIMVPRKIEEKLMLQKLVYEYIQFKSESVSYFQVCSDFRKISTVLVVLRNIYRYWNSPC